MVPSVTMKGVARIRGDQQAIDEPNEGSGRQPDKDAKGNGTSSDDRDRGGQSRNRKTRADREIQSGRYHEYRLTGGNDSEDRNLKQDVEEVVEGEESMIAYCGDHDDRHQRDQ